MDQTGTTPPSRIILHSAGRLIGSYVVASGIMLVVLAGCLGALGLALALGGFVIALPFLGVAVAVLAVFGRSVRAHLTSWCVAAPLAVVAAWLAVEYGTSYSQRGFSPLEFRNVIERAVMVLAWAGVASASFYRLERRQP